MANKRYDETGRLIIDRVHAALLPLFGKVINKKLRELMIRRASAAIDCALLECAMPRPEVSAKWQGGHLHLLVAFSDSLVDLELS